jgi:hypothetical protein
MLQIVETVLIPRQRGIKTPHAQQGVIVSPDRLLVVRRSFDAGGTSTLGLS